MASSSSGGRLVAGGRYELREEVGRGSFATVHRGEDTHSATPVAVKVIPVAKLTRKLTQNLHAEIAILQRLRHPHVVHLIAWESQDTRVHVVMEWCAWGDLAHFLRRHSARAQTHAVPGAAAMAALLAQVRARPRQIVPLEQTPLAGAWGGLHHAVAMYLFGQLVSALDFLRANQLMHRDLKPQNLLLHPPPIPRAATLVAGGTGDFDPLLPLDAMAEVLPARYAQLAASAPTSAYAQMLQYLPRLPTLKLADFGFARYLPGPGSMAETLCGSPLYMSPEILRYERYDSRADLWSVGVILYEMLVGRVPFRAANHIELLRKIERGGDRVRFPRGAVANPSAPPMQSEDMPPPVKSSDEPMAQLTVDGDEVSLLAHLLKQMPAQRMSVEAFFAHRGARDAQKMAEEVARWRSIHYGLDSAADPPTASPTNPAPAPTSPTSPTPQQQHHTHTQINPLKPKSVLAAALAQDAAASAPRSTSTPPVPIPEPSSAALPVEAAAAPLATPGWRRQATEPTTPGALPPAPVYAVSVSTTPSPPQDRPMSMPAQYPPWVRAGAAAAVARASTNHQQQQHQHHQQQPHHPPHADPPASPMTPAAHHRAPPRYAYPGTGAGLPASMPPTHAGVLPIPIPRRGSVKQAPPPPQNVAHGFAPSQTPPSPVVPQHPVPPGGVSALTTSLRRVPSVGQMILTRKSTASSGSITLQSAALQQQPLQMAEADDFVLIDKDEMATTCTIRPSTLMGTTPPSPPTPLLDSSIGSSGTIRPRSSSSAAAAAATAQGAATLVRRTSMSLLGMVGKLITRQTPSSPTTGPGDTMTIPSSPLSSASVTPRTRAMSLSRETLPAASTPVVGDMPTFPPPADAPHAAAMVRVLEHRARMAWSVATVLANARVHQFTRDGDTAAGTQAWRLTQLALDVLARAGITAHNAAHTLGGTDHVSSLRPVVEYLRALARRVQDQRAMLAARGAVADPVSSDDAMPQVADMVFNEAAAMCKRALEHRSVPLLRTAQFLFDALLLVYGSSASRSGAGSSSSGSDAESSRPGSPDLPGGEDSSSSGTRDWPPPMVRRVSLPEDRLVAITMYVSDISNTLVAWEQQQQQQQSTGASSTGSVVSGGSPTLRRSGSITRH